MLFYWPKLLYPYYSLLIFFPFSLFLSIGSYCGAEVFGLIVVYHSLSSLRCRPLSLIIIMIIMNNNNSVQKIVQFA